MPSYKVSTKSEYHLLTGRKTDSASYYRLHTDSIITMMDSVLERKKKVNQISADRNKKIISIEITKIPD